MNKEFLRALLETASPSGYEKNAAGLWKNEAEKFADLVYGDIHGNSIARITNGNITSSYSARIMLAGHIDEIGLIVSYIDPEGFIYFQTIGGWDPQVLVGQRVQIWTKDGQIAIGCIGRKPIHQLSEETQKQVVKIEDLWIDVGSKKCAKLVSVGDYAVVDYDSLFLDQNKFAARGIDDRIGAFVVLEALHLIKKEKLMEAVYAVATVQEEIGLRGAITSAYGINPQIGIAVDVTFAADFPGANKKEADIKLGKGPVIAIGPNITPAIYESLVKTAKENRIPHQIRAEGRGTGTDANAIQLSRSGVATGLVSIPNRYMHSPCEMVDLEDVENAIKLLARFCEKNIGSLLKSE